ncbi:acetate/propionate family kinase [Bombilactobacillus thymidiniphilus]|uniref:Acetate kinase n=1 Tax=Bombilactobacillus thymidiniphilus TaxID=2923363 RepID=A0ABY4PBS5_9LACO|nr:acetate kinase [Bombilactobacillus thymidiniphilus]UQS82971.1 acetate kinase [Bombilactobacillus thymidiniphilus]
MLIMAVNAGSSSLKWQIYDLPAQKQVAQGVIERLGTEAALFKVKFGDEQAINKQEPITSHEQAVILILTRLKELKVVDHLAEIRAVGHRVVSGGEQFTESTKITPKVIQQIDGLSELAPLHNHIEAYYMRVFAKLLPNAQQVAVFDTSFYSTLEPVNYLYPIDKRYYDDYQVRKYGAHGTSHRHVMQQAANMLHKKVQDVNLITLHLGSGASITAIANGQAIDTSMGFTPLAGVMMGTRSGDVDPSIIPYIMKKERITDVATMIQILNQKSGLLGVSGVSNDKRDVDEAAEQGNQRAKLAQKMFVNRIVKYVGSYLALLPKQADALVFTAGIGENDPQLRADVCVALSHLGVELDATKNNVRGKEMFISTADSPIKVLLIPTNEELMIAKDTYRLLD